MVSIFVRTLIIYILLSISLKTMGKRQIGELDVSELVSTLLISEIAAIPIDDPDLPLMNAIIPIIFILSLEIILSYEKTRHNKLKKYVEGEPIFLIYKKELQQDALIQNRISINEFLSEMRSQGIGDISEIDYAVIEQSGKISITKKGIKTAHSLVIDGIINQSELRFLNLDEKYILSNLEKRNLSLDSVFLLTLDDNQKINIIRKEGK